MAGKAAGHTCSSDRDQRTAAMAHDCKHWMHGMACCVAGKPPGIRLWAAYATLAVHASLLMQPAVRASPASQQAIVDVLLGCCLPALEAECRAAHGAGHSDDLSSMAHSGGHAAHAALLSNHSDEPAVAQHALLSTLPSLLANTDAPVGGAVKAYLAQQPRAAHSALRSAVSIVAALPEHPPPAGSAAADWLAGHQHAMQLLCLLLSMQAASQPPEVQVAQWLDELQLVPRVVAVMRHLGSNRQPGQAGRPTDFAIWSYCVLLQHVGIQTTNLQKSNAPMFTSPAGVTQWAAAAEAALRLLPLLASLVTQSPRPCWTQLPLKRCNPARAAWCMFCGRRRPHSCVAGACASWLSPLQRHRQRRLPLSCGSCSALPAAPCATLQRKGVWRNWMCQVRR